MFSAGVLFWFDLALMQISTLAFWLHHRVGRSCSGLHDIIKGWCPKSDTCKKLEQRGSKGFEPSAIATCRCFHSPAWSAVAIILCSISAASGDAGRNSWKILSSAIWERWLCFPVFSPVVQAWCWTLRPAKRKKSFDHTLWWTLSTSIFQESLKMFCLKI